MYIHSYVKHCNSIGIYNILAIHSCSIMQRHICDVIGWIYYDCLCIYYGNICWSCIVFFSFHPDSKNFKVESKIWNTLETDDIFVMDYNIKQSKSKHKISHLSRKCNIILTLLLHHHVIQHKYTVLIYYQVNKYTTDPLLRIKSAIRTISQLQHMF